MQIFNTSLSITSQVTVYRMCKSLSFFLQLQNGDYTQHGGAAQLVRASSQHAKVVRLIPSQGTYKNQPMNAK